MTKVITGLLMVLISTTAFSAIRPGDRFQGIGSDSGIRCDFKIDSMASVLEYGRYRNKITLSGTVLDYTLVQEVFSSTGIIDENGIRVEIFESGSEIQSQVEDRVSGGSKELHKTFKLNINTSGQILRLDSNLWSGRPGSRLLSNRACTSFKNK